MANSTKCVLWRRARTSAGYGVMRWRGKNHLVHRRVYEICFGPIPKGMHVMHTCDTPSCVSKEHLKLGTHQDNMIDMCRKGRHGTAFKGWPGKGQWAGKNAHIEPHRHGKAY